MIRQGSGLIVSIMGNALLAAEDCAVTVENDLIFPMLMGRQGKTGVGVCRVEIKEEEAVLFPECQDFSVLIHPERMGLLTHQPN